MHWNEKLNIWVITGGILTMMKWQLSSLSSKPEYVF